VARELGAADRLPARELFAGGFVWKFRFLAAARWGERGWVFGIGFVSQNALLIVWTAI